MPGTGNEARVEEQSHKSEMRAALQGDFERLRARRQTWESEGTGEQIGAGSQAAEPPAPVLLPDPAAARLSWLDRLRGHR